jgi:Lon-like protease
VLAVLALQAAASPAPWMTVSPGPVPEITGNVSGPVADPGFGEHGRVFFTTVEVAELTWAGWLRHHLSPRPHSMLVPAADDVSSVEMTAAANAQMASSKQVAFSVAAAAVEGRPLVASLGARVVSVSERSPAAAAGLRVGDVVTAAAGAAVYGHPELAAAVQASSGDRLALTVATGDVLRTVSVTPVREDDTWLIGVQVMPVTAAAPDAALDVATGGVGGPSGGLMFTLAFIDALSPGDLTAGLDLAGTGTIEPSGAVGEVGGADRKVFAARAAGASVFFAPTAAAGRLTEVPDGLEVVAVGSYRDAVEFLCGRGATDRVCGTLR